VCWNITRVSLWLLCDVHFVQSKQRTRLQTRAFERGINNVLKLSVCASRNQVVAHQPLKMTLNGFDVRCVQQWCTHRTSLVVKKKFSFLVAVNNSIKLGPLVFLL